MSQRLNTIAPASVDPDLHQYLHDTLVDVQLSLDNSNQIPITKVMPRKLSDGKIYYFPTANPADRQDHTITYPEIFEAGFWGRVNGTWVYLGASRVAYGAVNAPSDSAMSDFGTGWQDVPLTQAAITPENVTYDLTTDSISPQLEGTYMFNLTGSFSHNEENGGRQMEFRMRDIDLPTNSGIFLIGTGRNMPTTALSVSAVMEMTSVGVGDRIKAQVRAHGTDTYSSVVCTSFQLNIERISRGV